MDSLLTQMSDLERKVQERIRSIDERRLEHLRRQRADLDQQIAVLEARLESKLETHPKAR